jgi:hypothetical protein
MGEKIRERRRQRRRPKSLTLSLENETNLNERAMGVAFLGYGRFLFPFFFSSVIFIIHPSIAKGTPRNKLHRGEGGG